jgi:tether containing UBX domain for GLUT4
MDYEPSVTMVQATHSRLQASSQNKQLPSDAELERLDQEKAAKLAAIQEITIKVQFPDNSTVVFTYTADNTSNDLYQDAMDVIVAENEPFKLQSRIKSNKVEVIPRSEKKLVKDIGFLGRSVAQFVWEAGATEEGKKWPSLKPQYRDAAREIPVAILEPEDESKEGGFSKGGSGKKDGDTGGKSSGNKMSKFFPGLRNLKK